jgi:hypothetical protein
VNLAGHAWLAAIAISAAVAPRAGGQDSVGRVRHLLPLDISRIQPSRHVYEMVVVSADSSVRIGERQVIVEPADSAGGWLVTETRSGLVPAVDTLLLAFDARPVYWSSLIGGSRLRIEFGNDSASAALAGPHASRGFTFEVPPDIVGSGAMLEVVVGLLPHSLGWADSVTVLHADLRGVDVVAAEVVVVGEVTLMVESHDRPCWLVALRAQSRQVLHWVDKETGAVLRSQRAIPAHVGSTLEYRLLTIGPRPPT